MLDKPVDQTIINEIYTLSGVEYFNKDLKPFLKKIIRELYFSSDRKLALQLQLKHIDRALFKFRQAKEKTSIRNTRQYFKACLTSAVVETAFDELEPIDSVEE